jgi:hypothetical protein
MRESPYVMTTNCRAAVALSLVDGMLSVFAAKQNEPVASGKTT